MNLSELLLFLERIGARPQKRLSQNFLIDRNIVEKIVETADVKPGDCVLEIGPGPGALTKRLLEKGATVYAVEKDSLFARELERFQNRPLSKFALTGEIDDFSADFCSERGRHIQRVDDEQGQKSAKKGDLNSRMEFRKRSNGHLIAIEADILNFSLDSLPPGFKVVANLPYHITTPILEKVLNSSFSSLTIMVQKEVAERIEASAGSKIFGSLSLFVQFYTQKEASFKVSAHCFYPRPQVDSTVIRLDRRTPPDIPVKPFFSLVHKAFQQRRKKLTTSLPVDKELIKKTLTLLGLSCDARPEELDLIHWVELVKRFHCCLI